MYDSDQVARAMELVAAGHSFSEISRRTGVSRWAIRDWSLKGPPGQRRVARGNACAVCSNSLDCLPVGPYAYLLGLYLGDGSIAADSKGVYRLRIVCCNAYPDLMAECMLTFSEILPNRVGLVRCIGCTEVSAYSEHWPCLFPQHGVGAKHKRSIVLADWQREIVDRVPAPLLRGLIHSDGCRVLNWVNGTPYPRYHFSNASSDIRALFGRACDQMGISWRQNNARNLSVAKRESVRKLDLFVGPKR